MTVRHPKSRGEGFDPSSDEIITGNWSFTGSLTIPAASVIAQQGAVDHDQLKNFDQSEHFTMSQISITASQVSDLSTAGGLQNTVEDLSPQLGGDLDANCFKIENAKALFLKHSTPSSSITGQGQHTVRASDKAPLFTNDEGVSSRIPRVGFAETITADWTHSASLIMATSQILKWQDAAAVERDIMVLNSAEVAGAAIGHIITKLDTGVTTTSATYVSAAGALVAFSAMEANTDYAVMVRAYVGNATSSVTPQNKVRLAKGGVEVGNSEHVFESPSTTINSLGMLYEWGGIINSGASGDLQLQHLSGNGSDTCFVNDVVIMMIKVDDLVLNTNIFHDTDNSLVELDDGNFPPLVFFDTGAAVTIGDGSSDYLVFGSMKIQDFLTGGNTVTMHITDGTEIKTGSKVIRGDSSDQLTMGFWQLWEAPAAATTLTVKAQGTGFPVDKVGASIIAIRLNSFLDYQSTVVDTTPDLGNGPTDIATVAFTTSAAGDYGFLGGATGPDSDAVGAPQMIRNNLNGGGDVTIAGDATQDVASNAANLDAAQIAISVDQALASGDTIDADYHAPDAETPIVWFNGFLAVFQWTLVDTEPRLQVGNPLYTTEYRGREHKFFGADGADYVQFKHTGTDFDISGFQTADINITAITSIQAGTVDVDFKDITATSYGAILEANLLDRTINEIVTGRWDFESDGSAPQLCIVDSDSNGAATRAFIEYLGKGDVLTGRMGYLTASSGIFTIDNSLPNAGIELTSAGVQKLRVDIDGTTITGTIFVDNTSGEKVVLRDTNSTGNAVLNFISFKDMNDLRQGVIGFGSSSNDDLLIATDAGFGDVLLNPQGVTALRVSNVAVTISVPLTATSYDGILAANLLDKSAVETISGAYTFSANPKITKSGFTVVSFQPGGAGTSRQIGVDAAGDLIIRPDAATATEDLFYDRSLARWQSSAPFNVADALTAVSYNGVLAANLLDKTATEDITGPWTFSVGPTFFSAGTAGAPGVAINGDPDTGSFSPGANIYAITVGGTEAVRYTGTSAPLIRTGINSGITASTTQTQAGATPLTSSWNEVAVVANNNDAVVLPSMVKGDTCIVINSSTKKLQVFPASGKDAGAGVDISVTVKANSSRYWFHYDDIVAFDIATDFKKLQGVDTIGASANDLLYFDGVDWKHTNGDLTWDGVTLKAVILKPVKYVQHRTASTANLNDITHAVNTDPGKVEGAQVFNTNLNTPVWAKGSADGDKWVNGIGVVIHDPL